MKVNVINWILSKIESGEIAENQVVAVYDKNNNIVYLGKAEFAPLSLWDEFKTATIVSNELRINERQPEHETEPEHETVKIEVNVNAIIADLRREFELRNAAECDTDKIDVRGGSDFNFINAQDRYERHDDKITAIIHMLRYAFAIDVTYKTNGYGYVIEFTLDGENIHETINIELQGYIARWLESEKQRINEKYFS